MKFVSIPVGELERFGTLLAPFDFTHDRSGAPYVFQAKRMAEFMGKDDREVAVVFKPINVDPADFAAGANAFADRLHHSPESSIVLGDQGIALADEIVVALRKEVGFVLQPKNVLPQVLQVSPVRLEPSLFSVKAGRLRFGCATASVDEGDLAVIGVEASLEVDLPRIEGGLGAQKLTFRSRPDLARLSDPLLGLAQVPFGYQRGKDVFLPVVEDEMNRKPEAEILPKQIFPGFILPNGACPLDGAPDRLGFDLKAAVDVSNLPKKRQPLALAFAVGACVCIKEPCRCRRHTIAWLRRRSAGSDANDGGKEERRPRSVHRWVLRLIAAVGNNLAIRRCCHFRNLSMQSPQISADLASSRSSRCSSTLKSAIGLPQSAHFIF